VLPYFKRAETRKEGGNAYRGGDGPLSTTYGTLDNPLHHAWMEAARQAGYQLTEDYNGFQQEGFGRMDMTVRNGERCSSAKAHLYDAVKRPNLQVCSMRWPPASCSRARARWAWNTNAAARCTPRAGREVILSGGPINSVQLLKLRASARPRNWPAMVSRSSPIAPASAPTPGSPEFYFQMACTQPITLFGHANLVGKARWASNGCCAARPWRVQPL
jgi:choline dehydrogenase